MTPNAAVWNALRLAGEPFGRELPQSSGHTSVPPEDGTVFPHGVLLRAAARGTFAQSE